ncbi:unnamed protein product, partial [Mesorhabditis belari]|uniref:Uncharacterized protein n=1 Tax=Mesorhabditis belari TaxID=2138241 RepID=A0AAF3FB16_9BILA
MLLRLFTLIALLFALVCIVYGADEQALESEDADNVAPLRLVRLANSDADIDLPQIYKRWATQVRFGKRAANSWASSVRFG